MHTPKNNYYCAFSKTLGFYIVLNQVFMGTKHDSLQWYSDLPDEATITILRGLYLIDDMAVNSKQY